MPKFSVAVRRRVVEQAWIDVEAKTTAAAKRNAMNALMSGDTFAWDYVTSPEEWIETVFDERGVELTE